MKTCSTQVTKLTKDFDEFKVVDAAKSEVDASRLIVINKLKYL